MDTNNVSAGSKKWWGLCSCTLNCVIWLVLFFVIMTFMNFHYLLLAAWLLSWIVAIIFLTLIGFIVLTSSSEFSLIALFNNAS